MKLKITSLLGLICLNAQGASVIANSGFEAFSIDDTGYNAPYNSGSNPNGYVDNYGPVSIYLETVAGIGWQTDAPSSVGTQLNTNSIELWKSGAFGYDSSTGIGQFAELNAYTNAALFQDVTIADGGLVDYSFSHRGRNGVDTAKVLITYFGADNTLGGGDDSVVVDSNFTTGNTAWADYAVNDAFTSVAGGTYRFSFGAVSSVGKISEGNFLDNVQFGVNVVPEPSAALLGSLGAFALLRRRRR